MKVNANLSSDDVKEAIVDFLRKKGFNTTVDKVGFFFPVPDHPDGREAFSAFAECDSKPQTLYRGIQDESAS
jgi:hypothetical protein